MPTGWARASTTTTDPTSCSRMRAATCATVRSASQVTAPRRSSERSGRANVCCSSASRRSTWPCFFPSIRGDPSVLQARIVGLARGSQRLAERGNPRSASNGTSLRKISPVSSASPSAVWRPMTRTPSRSAMDSSLWSSWLGCTAADSSSVSSTGWANMTPVLTSFSSRNRMSNAALCPTSTVSSQKRWNNGSTWSITGCPSRASAPMPWMRADSRASARRGFTSCSNTSFFSSRPLTIRTAPMLMISSPADGSSPVVSVSNAV